MFKYFRDGLTTRAHYKNYCRLLGYAIRQAKQAYVRNRFRSISGDSTKTWREINILKGTQTKEQ